MSTEEAQGVLIATAARLAGIGAADYVVDADNAAGIHSLAAWLARERTTGIDPNKAVLLMGNVGSGKSLLMRALSRSISDLYGVRAFGVKGCADLVRAFNIDGYDGEVEDWMHAPHICLDDLGTEDEAIHFGKRTNLIGEIIEARYDTIMRGRKAWTNLTTNMGSDAIRERYGARVYSRITHICNIVAVGASSSAIDRRKKAALPPAVEQVDPDSMYTRIHPAVAEAIRRGLGPPPEAPTTGERMEPAHIAELRMRLGT